MEEFVQRITRESGYKGRLLSGVVHTGVEVYRMDSEMSELVEQHWL